MTHQTVKTLYRPLTNGINKKVIGKFKDELNGFIMTEFCAPRAKTCAFKDDDGKETKKAIGTKKCVIKKDLKFMITKIQNLKIKSYLDHKNALKVIIMVYVQKK